METIRQARVRVRGDLALFPRPEFRRDQVSYEVLTPTAARGILDQIHWRPAITWIVDVIHVCRPIGLVDVSDSDTSPDDLPRRLALRDVEYVIGAHFMMTDRAGELDEPIRHRAMFRRRLRSPQSVYFGMPAYSATATIVPDDEVIEPIPGFSADLGWIVHGTDPSDRGRLRFFRARMVDGLVMIPPAGSEDIYG